MARILRGDQYSGAAGTYHHMSGSWFQCPPGASAARDPRFAMRFAGTSRAPSYSTFVYGGESSYRWVGYPVPSKYDDLITQLARSYRLEPALVKAVMHCESAFNPSARSHKGATGLMQLMPDTARRFGVRNIYNPVENVTGGVRYLQWLFRYFDGNIHHVLAGYNAGENAVTRYDGIPPYTETRDYVRRVLKMRDLYRRDYSGQTTS